MNETKIDISNVLSPILEIMINIESRLIALANKHLDKKQLEELEPETKLY